MVSGTCLALGVLLEYFPIVLLPFLALDRGRIRPRFLAVAVSSSRSACGQLSEWGPTIFAPLTFAATRASNVTSIFYFLRGHFHRSAGSWNSSTSIRWRRWSCS